MLLNYFVALAAGFAVAAHGATPKDPVSMWAVPTRAAQRQNPVPRTEAAIARGKALFVRECVACHGKTGRGDGPKAPDLKVNPGDFSRPATTQQSDGELFWKITRGRTPMPAYRSRFSDQDRWMLVHFIRTLGNADAQTASETTSEAEPKPQKRSEPATTNNVAATGVSQKPVTTAEPQSEPKAEPTVERKTPETKTTEAKPEAPAG